MGELNERECTRFDSGLYVLKTVRKAGEPYTLLTDSHGAFLVKRGEMRWLIRELQRTLDNISDEELLALEKRLFLERHPEMFSSLYGDDDPMWRDYLVQQYKARQNEPKRDAPAPSRQGYVYVLAGNGFYKIGLTTTPQRRVQTLREKAPFPVEVLFFIPTEDRHQTERELHERFADKRSNGEWFTLTPEDVAWIQNTYDVLSLDDGGEA